MLLTVKAFLQGENGRNIEIRRFLINSDSSFGYTMLASKISNIFPALTSRCFNISWKDSENDEITMSSDEELALAVASIENSLLKVYVRFANKNIPSAEKVGNAEAIHLNVVCDGCDGKVIGARYKCLQCEDYDLCNDCHMKDVHPNHDMLKLNNPIVPQRWVFRGWKRVFEHIFGHNPHGCGPNIPDSQRFRANHFRCHKFEKSGEQNKPSSQNEAKQSEDKAKSSEFLSHIGEAVATFLDPLGIDVKIDLEHPDGERLPFSIFKKADSQESQKTKSEAATETENASTAGTSGPSQKSFSSASSPSTSSASTCTSSSKVDIDENPKSNADLGAEGWTVVNDSSELNELNEPQRKESSTNTLPEQTECTTPKKPEQAECTTPKKPEQAESTTPKKVGGDNTEAQKLAPNIEVALNIMKAMGFDTLGNDMIPLLEANQGNISSVLDVLFPGMRNN